MEYASKGSLSGLLKSLKNVKREIPIETCRFFVAELVLALEYLNSKNIYHRDLKPENILIDADYHLKICDFGEAKVIKKLDNSQIQKEFDQFQKKEEMKRKLEKDSNDDEDELQIENYDPLMEQEEDKEDANAMFDEQLDNNSDGSFEEDPFADMFEEYSDVSSEEEKNEPDFNMLNKPKMEHRGTFVGTPLYASPEMLNSSSSGPFTDLWALGVIVYQIVCGEVPWKGNQEMQIF